MLKKFRKVTVLALALAMIFAMSANVFAVDTWTHIWYASDDVTTVEYYATIDATRTYGDIISGDNQGEVRVDANAYYDDPEGGRKMMRLGYTDIDYAHVYAAAPTGTVMTAAEYSFYAYVGSTGDEFESGCITVSP